MEAVRDEVLAGLSSQPRCLIQAWREDNDNIADYMLQKISGVYDRLPEDDLLTNANRKRCLSDTSLVT